MAFFFKQNGRKKKHRNLHMFLRGDDAMDGSYQRKWILDEANFVDQLWAKRDFLVPGKGTLNEAVSVGMSVGNATIFRRFRWFSLDFFIPYRKNASLALLN